jgi:hypothetical protein
VGVVVNPLRALWVTSTGLIDIAVLLPTEPVAAVLGSLAYGSSTTLAMVELLTVVDLTPRLSM